MDTLTLLLAALAVLRLSMLIAVEDGPFDFARRARDTVAQAFPPVATEPGVYEDHWIVRGVNCPRCVSFWLAALAALFVAPSLLTWLGIAGAVLILLRWADA